MCAGVRGGGQGAMLFSAVLHKSRTNIFGKEAGNKVVHSPALKGTEIGETNGKLSPREGVWLSLSHSWQ